MNSLDWVLGPAIKQVVGPMKVKLKLNGERITSCDVETGFAHKSLEKILENTSIQNAMPLVDRVDAEGAIFSELAYCLALEKILKIEVPLRASAVRVILCELQRISQHLGTLANCARVSGTEVTAHLVLREKEKVLDLVELLTGARFTICFLRLGGVCSNVSDGFLEKAIEVCDQIHLRIKEYNDLFSFNSVFLGRSVNKGVISPGQARRFGLTGPNLRASGVLFDIRELHPYSGYDRYDFTIPIGAGEFGEPGDIHDRILVRLREILESIQIVRQAVERIPSGPCLSEIDYSRLTVKSEEEYVRVESARGLLGCLVALDESQFFPNRVQWSVPSIAALAVFEKLAVGMQIEDLPLFAESLNISAAEIDR